MERSGVWDGVDRHWRRAMELAWESFVEGSIAVGAVVLGPDGERLAEGRNRSGDLTPPPGQVGGAYIAHAEVNALARVPLAAAEPMTLLTTLEPCALCRAATRYAHIAEVRHAAGDPIWAGMEKMGELNPYFGRRFPRFSEAALGPLSTWSGALPLVSIVHRVAGRRAVSVEVVLEDDAVVIGNREGQPAYVALAERLLADGLAPGTDLGLEQALARWISSSGTLNGGSGGG